MEKFKFLLIVIFFMLILFSYTVKSAEGIRVAADSAILMDEKTSRTLWGKNIDKPRAMASTTKIMTCIVALESGKSNEILTVSRNAARAPKVKLYLQTGEKQRVEDMLYALMLVSANDAAVAIAEHISGSVDAFCEQMTKKAKEIGCTDTIFETPNGLDKGKHHSTAKDMAIIAKYALKNKKFMQIINTQKVITPILGGNYRKFYLSNHNRLLKEFTGANGFKTGFTNLAGHCFVGGAKRDDMQLISVVLASGWGARGKKAKWTDTKKILNYGFNNFSYKKILNKNQVISKNIHVCKSKNQNVDLIIRDNIEIIYNKNNPENIKIKTYYPNNLNAPLNKNKSIGRIEIYMNNECVSKKNLYPNNNIKENSFKRWFNKLLVNFFKQINIS